MNINKLSTPNLFVGQTLKLPSENNNTVTDGYIVKKGDTLYSIANSNNTTVNEIKSLNNLSTNILSIGQVLKLPENSANTIYTVVKGDNLYSIARKYNTTVDKIKTANNLSTDILSIGQKLIIP